MSIWFNEISVDSLNHLIKNTMCDYVGIQFTEVGNNYLKATMPVSEKTIQPIGILHGGANLVLAETIASVAANSVIDYQKFHCVGLEINANHIRPVREGIVTAVTTPIHIGRTTQIWHIDIFNDSDKQTCVSRMTASVTER